MQKLKAAAMILIGLAFAGNSIHDYITLGDLTRIPRILFPLYKILGPLGTTIAICILGLLLVVYGVYTWRKAKPAGETGEQNMVD